MTGHHPWATIEHKQPLDPRAQAQVVDRLVAVTDLHRVQETFDLSPGQVGALFGVSADDDKLAAVAALIDLLARKLKPDRIPTVVRQPIAAAGGQTVLDLIAEDRHHELLVVAVARIGDTSAL